MPTWEITKLPSGYWHARLGSERFVQWPIGWAPREEHGFHLAPGDLDDLLSWTVTAEGQAEFARAAAEAEDFLAVSPRSAQEEG